MLSTSVFGLSDLQLRSGIYEVVSATHTSVCPQKIDTRYVDGELSSLKVVYVGECFYMGPYFYSCDPERNLCGSGKNNRQYIVYTIHSDKSFHWHNLAYNVEAEFELSEE